MFYVVFVFLLVAFLSNAFLRLKTQFIMQESGCIAFGLSQIYVTVSWAHIKYYHNPDKS